MYVKNYNCLLSSISNLIYLLLKTKYMRNRIPIIKRLVILEDTNEHIIVSNTNSKAGDLTLFPNSNNGEVEWEECISTMITKAKYDYGSNGVYNFKVIERNSKIKGISGQIID